MVNEILEILLLTPPTSAENVSWLLLFLTILMLVPAINSISSLAELISVNLKVVDATGTLRLYSTSILNVSVPRSTLFHATPLPRIRLILSVTLSASMVCSRVVPSGE